MKKKFAFISEIVGAFVILHIINYFVCPNDPAFLTMPINPYWIIVLLIPSRYGLFPGILAGVIAAAHVLFVMFGGVLPTRIEMEIIFEAKGIALPMAFIAIGIILGGIREKYKNLEDNNEHKLTQRNDELNQLKKNFDSLEKVKNILEGRIVGETATVKMLHHAAGRFDDLEIANVYQGCLDILKEYIKVDKASIYLRDQGCLLLKASIGWQEGENVEAKLNENKSIMSLAIEQDRILTVKDILNNKDAKVYESQFGKVLAMFPFKDNDGNTIGVVNIEEIDFLLLNKANLELMGLIVDWAEKAIRNKSIYMEAKSKIIFDEQLRIYYYQHFDRVLEREFNKAKHYKLDLSAAFIKVERFGFFNEDMQRLIINTMLSLLKKNFSELDMIFRYKFNGTFAVICPLRGQKDIVLIINKILKEFDGISKSGELKSQSLSVVLSSCFFKKETKSAYELIEPALKECKLN